MLPFMSSQEAGRDVSHHFIEGISRNANVEALILWPSDVKNWLNGKDPDAGKDWRQEEKGMTEDETFGWHHWLSGLEFEQTLGDSEGQESLACCSPWGRRVGHDWAIEQQQSKNEGGRVSKKQMATKGEFSSGQFSHSVVSNSLRPHESQHTRPLCPPLAPRVYSNSCPLSRWCHPTISSSVVPFSSWLQSFQHQGLFKWVSSSHEVAKVLELQLQHQSFQWTPRTDLL